MNNIKETERAALHKTIWRIAVVGKTEFNKVYDPACGSGSLLLKFSKILGPDKVRLGFFGQEINLTTDNLCRINMFLHDISDEKFNIAHGDTLTDPKHWDDQPFDVIVSNPPYSLTPQTCLCAASGNKNKLTAAHQQKILDAFTRRENIDIDHFARLVDNKDIAANGYNLTVSSYVEEADNRRGGGHQSAQRRDCGHRGKASGTEETDRRHRG